MEKTAMIFQVQRSEGRPIRYRVGDAAGREVFRICGSAWSEKLEVRDTLDRLFATVVRRHTLLSWFLLLTDSHGRKLGRVNPRAGRMELIGESMQLRRAGPWMETGIWNGNELLAFVGTRRGISGIDFRIHIRDERHALVLIAILIGLEEARIIQRQMAAAAVPAPIW